MEQLFSCNTSSPVFQPDLNVIIAIFFSSVLCWISTIKKFYARFVFRHTARFFPVGSKLGAEDKTEKEDGLKLSAQEMKAVLEMMGISCGAGEPAEGVSAGELSRLFEEEPSLEEVKEAFAVFDKNGDGYIDAEELKIVLPWLGYSEGSTLENCRQMISAYDDNNDGKIDFPEFLKCLERSFS